MVLGVLSCIICSHQYYVEKILFDVNYKVKYTTNNWKLVHFMFSHAVKADKNGN